MINNSSTEDLIEKKLLFLQKQKQNSNYWNITQEQGTFLANLIVLKQPKSILEIGTSNGFSTLYLAKKLPTESKITTIEVDETRFKEAKQNFKVCNIKNITSINDGALNYLKSLNKKDKFDFIFIDAGHKFYGEIFNLIIEKQILDVNSYVIFDNITTHKYLNNFVEDLKNSYKTTYIDIGGGMLVIKIN